MELQTQLIKSPRRIYHYIVEWGLVVILESIIHWVLILFEWILETIRIILTLNNMLHVYGACEKYHSLIIYILKQPIHLGGALDLISQQIVRILYYNLVVKLIILWYESYDVLMGGWCSENLCNVQCYGKLIIIAPDYISPNYLNSFEPSLVPWPMTFSKSDIFLQELGIVYHNVKSSYLIVLRGSSKHSLTSS